MFSISSPCHKMENCSISDVIYFVYVYVFCWIDSFSPESWVIMEIENWVITGSGNVSLSDFR